MERNDNYKYVLENPKYYDLEYISAYILISIFREATPEWRIEESFCDFTDITYILDGEATYIVNDVAYEVKKGDLICIPHGSKRKAFTDAKNPMKSFAVNAFLFNFSSSSGDIVDLPLPIVSKVPNPSRVIELFKELNNDWMEKRSGHILKCRAILMMILHEILEQLYFPDSPAFMDLRVAKMVEYINKNYARKITVNSLAEMWNLNPVYLGVLFKNNMNVSIKRYLNTVRVNEAEKLLAQGETAARTAELCGFEDVFYFSKVYKEIKGCPPSLARKKK